MEMATSKGAPVPVPKDSLFKLAVDLTKAQVKTAKTTPVTVPASVQPEGFTAFNKAHAVPDPAMVPQAAPVGVPGVPLIKAKVKPEPVLSGVIPVAIPYSLAQSIANKPSTGGGWQAIMGELQKGLVVAPDPEHPGVPDTPQLNLTPTLLAKLVDKATAHGMTGGYQSVIKSIVCLAVKQHPGQILAGKGE